MVGCSCACGVGGATRRQRRHLLQPRVAYLADACRRFGCAAGDPGGENAYAPAVSPDGRFVVYLAVRGDWPGPGLFRIRADGSDELRLTVSLKDGFSSWSPDGRHIVFSRVYSGNTSSLYVMRADGTHEHSIGVAGGWPSYTPDGRRILFGNTDENGGGIYSVRPDGTGLRQLTDTADDESPVASPDGTQILFTRTVVNQGDPDQKDIYKINADGTGEINLTNDPADDSTATWSPDGQRIAFYSERDGRGHLWSMQADGSQPEPLAGSGSIDWEPSWSATPSTCLGRPVTITGTSGPDVLHGTPGPDVISALGGSDRIYGTGGKDVVCGGAGHDILRGSTGADRFVRRTREGPPVRGSWTGSPGRRLWTRPSLRRPRDRREPSLRLTPATA
nr:DUF5050 domain-containing protein [Nocardioides ungokensis]